MSEDDDIDVDELLSEINKTEEELMELVESPANNAEAIKTEADRMANIAKATLRSYEDLKTELDQLNEQMESSRDRAEQLKERADNAMNRLGYETDDE